MSTTLIEMADNPLQQAFVLARVERLQVVFPPDVGLDLGPSDGESIVDRSPGTGGIGVKHQRTINTQLGGERLLVAVAIIQAHAASIVGDRLVKQLRLGQVVLVRDSLQSELTELLAKIHSIFPEIFKFYNAGVTRFYEL